MDRVVAYAFGAPMPEADAGIVRSVCCAGTGAVVSAPDAHASAVVGQIHHSYAIGPVVVEY